MKLKSTLTIFFLIAILAGLLPNAFGLAAMQRPQQAYSLTRAGYELSR